MRKLSIKPGMAASLAAIRTPDFVLLIHVLDPKNATVPAEAVAMGPMRLSFSSPVAASFLS
jgi:hypothetical protein